MIKSTFVCVFVATLLFISCSTPEATRFAISTDFEEYISGFTSGEISKHGEIAVSFVQEVPTERENGLFKLSPEVKGKTEWVNNKTILFKPDAPLKNNEEYSVEFALGKVIDVPQEKEVFVFKVKTIKQDLEVDFSGIEPLPGDRNEQQIEGVIYTADRVELSEINKVLEADQEGEKISISWKQDGQQKSHQFQLSGILRKEKKSKVVITWDGTPIDAEAKGTKSVNVLEVGAFELLETRVFRNQNPRIELTFSDPLQTSQNLEGLVRLERPTRLNLLINENKLTITPRARRTSTEVIVVDEALQSKEGKKLGTTIKREVRFSQPNPSVEYLGKGVIMPRSSNLYLPFKAVSLGAVDVSITKIFETNIGQFLQEQNLSGINTWNIQKVGRRVFGEAIPLSSLGSVDPGSWNNYALDLSKMIEPEPGAIYMVEIGFRAHQAVLDCGEANTLIKGSIENRSWELTTEEETEYWNNFGSYYYPRNYNWRDRDNPCTESYYYRDRKIIRNVLASDLGIIAKKAENGEVQLFVTDIRTANPKMGVKVTLFDFQQQELASSTTNADGRVILTAERTPYYAVASIGDQKGYLRLDDGTALSVSDFDVSGARVQKGVKGFLYCERGVWRPGDTLFVSLILEDQNDVLPEDHPVTFELIDPSGQRVDRQTFNGSLNGFYTYQPQTEKQAPTGNWRVTAKVGALSFSKTLKVETVKPNRLKVEVDFDKEEVNGRDRLMKATLSSRWLHGAIAKNLKADIEMNIVSSAPQFQEHQNFSFSDEAISFSSTPSFIFEGKLNEKGEVSVEHTFPELKEGPARVSVNLNLRVFEPSGSFSVGRATTYFYPFKTILGIKSPQKEEDTNRNWLSRKKDQAFEVVSLDEKGNPRSNEQLEYEVYHIQWRWWWERNRENLSSFFERRDVRKVLSGKATTNNVGEGKFNIKLPNSERGGRYLVRVKGIDGGHSASEIVYFDWWGNGDESVSPARLTFSSDKESYQVEEEITLTIPSSEGSKILVSLETGSKILKTAWIDAKAEETTFKFIADASMSPNVYAHVMHVQPHGQEKNDLPIRMYGVIPIEVEDPFTILNPQIETQSEFRPETTSTINISEENGRAMTYTIALVDEGLLDLTNFRTPKPHDVFYAREALGIKTWDMFEYVTNGFSGNISRILSVGGDGSEAKLDPLNEANRFKPMVRFEGPFSLKAGEVNRHNISIPNYVGSVRTMVIAGQDGAYGQKEKTTPVRKPVMVLATLPRVLGPAETVSLPVSVFAMKEGIKNVQVRVEASDIFEVQGVSTATVQFEEPGDELAIFTLKTKSQIGVGKVRVEVKSGEETAYHEIEIAVRNPNTPFVDVRSKILEEGEQWEEVFESQGMLGTNKATLEVSRIPPIDFGRRLDYLLQYPHGCIEQTTSSVFPQLFVGKVMELDSERKEKIESNIQAGITRIAKFMTPTGGLGYWPGNSDPNAWGTTYAYHFLLEAQKLGYYVPSALMTKINQYQKAYARNWTETEYRYSDLLQAYRLYTLALANTPELGAMNRFRERQELTSQARWRLASAYVLVGQPEAANEILTSATLSIPEYKELSRNFGSSVRDQAMILETLALLQRREDAALVARDISAKLSSNTWLNTQATAYSLIGITKFLDQFDAAGEIDAIFSLNSTKQGSIKSGAFITQISLNVDEFNQNRFVIDNNTEGTLFTRLILEGTPLIGDNISFSNSLVQKVEFLDLNGNKIDPAVIEQGTDFIAEVSLSNPGLRGEYKEMALTQIFPSGWEIRNTRMDDQSFSEPTSSFDYQDIRDDRVFTYFNLAPNKTKVFRVQLNASYVGEFYLPAVSTSAMYDETISSRTAGNWVNVVAAE